MLSDNGVQPMHPTIVAKIESGDRSVRINEAVGIADLFEVSVDSLLGRKPGTQERDLTYRLGALAASAHESYQLLVTVIGMIREPLEELPDDFDGAGSLREAGFNTLSGLGSARGALAELLSVSGDFLLKREQVRLGKAQP